MTAFLIACTSLPGSFTYDDYMYIIHETTIGGQTRPHNAIASYEDAWHASFFRRFANLSFAWDVRHHDFRHPLGFHLWNVVLHALCALLVYLLTNALCACFHERDPWISRIAACLFACHPLATEAVCYAVCRYVLFVTLFTLAGTLSLIKAWQCPRKWKPLWAGASLSCWCLAMQSKEVGLFFPPAIACFFFHAACARQWRGRRPVLFWCVTIAPFFAAVLMVLWLRTSPEHPPISGLATKLQERFHYHEPFTQASHGYGSAQNRTFGTYILTECRVFPALVSLFAWPFGRLNIQHEFTWSDGLFQPASTFPSSILCIMIALLAVFGGTRADRPESRMALTGLQILVTGYLPYMFLTNLELMVEYKFHLPLVGLCIIASTAFGVLRKKFPEKKRFLWGIMLLLLSCLAACFVLRCRKWQQPERIWQTAAERSRTWARPWVVLAQIHHRRAQHAFAQPVRRQHAWQTAEENYRRALARDGRYLSARQSLGILYLATGKLDRAQSLFADALKQAPGNADLLNNLGLTHYKKNENAEAEARFQQALALQPDHLHATINLAQTHERLGHRQAAMSALKKAVKTHPESAKAQTAYANALSRAGRYAQALAHYQKARKLYPGSKVVDFNVANALARMGRWEDALQAYHTALTMDPNNARAYSDMGTILYRQGDLQQAMQHYQKAVRLDPSLKEVYNYMGIVALNLGHVAEGAAHFEKALDLDPDYDEAKQHLQQARALLQHATE